ncbi:MAG: hypothetical protein J6L88_07640 [Clostridia bacterium]|nr:hypothetical protein [Clostridia bacterium]
MGPFGMPWSIFVMYALGTVGVLVLAEIWMRSKKFKNLLEFYFSWNEDETTQEKRDEV